MIYQQRDKCKVFIVGIIVCSLFSFRLFLAPRETTDTLSSKPSKLVTSTDQNPLITFGVITDIQYAPIPDGFSFDGAPRYYRNSLAVTRYAAEQFQKENVPLVVNLGDTIDGKCQELEEICRDELQECDIPQEGSDPSLDAVDDVLNALSPYAGKIIHTYGNHDLYNFNRNDIGNKLNIPFVREIDGDLVGYYSYDSPCKTTKFVVLDSYDVAIMQRNPENSSKRQQAMQILKENNPNYPEQENSSKGLKGLDMRFVAYNGAVGKIQLEWLRNTLEEAKVGKQKVIILSHQPIMPGSTLDDCLIWNYAEVLEILREYKCTVAAALAGHDHVGGYHRDAESGIHFRVIESVLESKAPNNTFGFVDLYEDKLAIRGVGDCVSAIYQLDHLCT